MWAIWHRYGGILLWGESSPTGWIPPFELFTQATRWKDDEWMAATDGPYKLPDVFSQINNWCWCLGISAGVSWCSFSPPCDRASKLAPQAGYVFMCTTCARNGGILLWEFPPPVENVSPAFQKVVEAGIHWSVTMRKGLPLSDTEVDDFDCVWVWAGISLIVRVWFISPPVVRASKLAPQSEC